MSFNRKPQTPCTTGNTDDPTNHQRRNEVLALRKLGDNQQQQQMMATLVLLLILLPVALEGLPWDGLVALQLMMAGLPSPCFLL